MPETINRAARRAANAGKPKRRTGTGEPSPLAVPATREEIAAFFARHAHEARRNPEKDFWWMQPLCPPTTMDALDAFRQLHRELQQWVTGKGRRDAKNVKFWDAAEALCQGHVYGEPAPLAQIAWLTGPVNWPALLIMGRSYSGKIFMHQGKRHYIEPQDKYVIGMMPLD